MQYPIKYTHEERVKLSQEILGELKDKYKEDLLAIALFGSMSRNTDNEYSDVDMIAIVKGEHIVDVMQGITNGLKYGVDIFSEDIVQNKIISINMRWPLLVGKFVTAQPLLDDLKLFESYRELFNETIKKDFSPYIQEMFIEEIFEECQKLIHLSSYGTSEQAKFAAFNLLTKMISFLGVINKDYYLGSSTFVDKAMSFPINFSSFKKLGENILSNNLDNDEINTMAIGLLNEITDYLESNGIKFEE